MFSEKVLISYNFWTTVTFAVGIFLSIILGLTKEYAYISPSLTKFLTGKDQVALAYKLGFVNAKHYPIIGGMMGILVITK